MGITNQFDNDLFLEFERYRKLVEKEGGYLEAMRFERFVEVLWMTQTTNGIKRRTFDEYGAACLPRL